MLEAGKTLMVPTPRLSQGLFNRLEPDPEDSSKDRLRQLASRHGIDNLSKPIPMASRIKLDMVVIGSVAVDRLGHRIGKGEGRSPQNFHSQYLRRYTIHLRKNTGTHKKCNLLVYGTCL